MNDIGLFIQDGFIDIEIENGDLKADDGLETACLISLFTDARIRADELTRDETSKRGWFGDLFPDVDGDKIGSKLWLLDRSKQSSSILVKFEENTRECLKWLVEDGVASDILVNASYPERGQILIDVNIIKPIGENEKFGFIWDGQELIRG